MTTFKKIALAWMLCILAGAAAAGDLPDPRRTPGATNPDVTQSNIQQTVCVRGFTKSIRPPAYYTNKLKKVQIGQYGYSDRNPRNYEEDHLVALSIGGASQDERNLWPQPRNSEWGAEKKDQLEFVMYKMVCAGELPLATAQREMAADWVAAWKRYVPSHRGIHFNSVD
jgi:hypothetical protein